MSVSLQDCATGSTDQKSVDQLRTLDGLLGIIGFWTIYRILIELNGLSCNFS